MTCWRAGMLAVCISESWGSCEYGRPATLPKKGNVYRIDRVTNALDFGDPRLQLVFDEFEGWRFCARNFRPAVSTGFDLLKRIVENPPSPEKVWETESV